MNRVVITGAAAFFALVGVALFGGADKAAAGHGCGGCDGHVICGGNDCSDSCGGRVRALRARLRTACSGNTCCEPAPAPCCEPACPPSCCGEVDDCCGRVSLLDRIRARRCSCACSGDTCSDSCSCSCGGLRARMGARRHCCGSAPVCPPTCCG